MTLFIDCDTGRDDALTLWTALALKMPLAGVLCSYGNVALPRVADNTARVLSFGGGGGIPVFAGAAGPLHAHRGFRETTLPRQKISGNGLCGVLLPPAPAPAPLPPADLAAAIEGIARDKGPLDYFIIGPATNLASLCGLWGEKTKDILARVTMMGGKTGALWDEMPGADFNLACDPFAARALLQRGLGVRFVTMNTTWPLLLTLEELEALKPSPASPVAAKAKEIMIAHAKHFAPMTGSGPVFRFHDPAALLALGDDAGFRKARLDIECDESSPSFGRLVETENGFSGEIHDAPPECGEDFKDRILAALGLS